MLVVFFLLLLLRDREETLFEWHFLKWSLLVPIFFRGDKVVMGPLYNNKGNTRYNTTTLLVVPSCVFVCLFVQPKYHPSPSFVFVVFISL